METRQIHAAATARGVTRQALDAVTFKVQTHFEGRTASPVEVDSFIAGLPPWDKLGMEQATFDSMPVTWRYAQGQAYQSPVVKQRPGPVSYADAAAFAQMSVEDFNKLPSNKRADYARELQAQQQTVR